MLCSTPSARYLASCFYFPSRNCKLFLCLDNFVAVVVPNFSLGAWNECSLAFLEFTFAVAFDSACSLSLSLSHSHARPPGEVIHVRAMTSLSVAVVVVAASACHHAAYAFRFMCVRVCTLHMFSSQGPFIYCITRLDFDPISLACCLNKFRHAPSPCTSATASAFASATKWPRFGTQPGAS